jgi:putative transposon-encoded protein
MSKLINIYNVKPIKKSSSAKIIIKGQIDSIENIVDEPIVCQYESKNVDEKFKYIHMISNKVHVKFFRSMITESQLMSTKILPVIHCLINYEDKYIGGPLVNIYIEFKIESDIKSEKDLIENKIDGKYRINIMKEDSEPKIIELDLFSTERTTIEILKSFVNSKEIEEIIKDTLEIQRLKRVKQYGSFDNIEIPKPTYNFKKMVEQYEKSGKIVL